MKPTAMQASIQHNANTYSIHMVVVFFLSVFSHKTNFFSNTWPCDTTVTHYAVIVVPWNGWSNVVTFMA